MQINKEKVKTIVALIALPEEHETFQKVFPYKADLSSQKHVSLEHHTNTSGVKLISVLAEQMGAQSAASSAEWAIKNFAPDMVVVIGIAGGISTDLALGDVVVSNEIIDILHNTKISDKDGLEIEFAPYFYNIDAELVASFAFLSVHPALRPSYDRWRDEALDDAKALFPEKEQYYHPTQIIGHIACGPVSASKQFNAKLQALHRKVVAIETESGGVFQRIVEDRIPTIAIRGISDMADKEKSALEKSSKGAFRKLAMVNACKLLKTQLENSRFLDVAARHAQNKNQYEISFGDSKSLQVSIVGELEREITGRLKDLSFDFKSRPEGFYLPIPRARRVSYTDELSGRKVSEPENITDCLRLNNRTILRMPRAFPSTTLGWSLAHSLLRQQIDGKVILPFVINGSNIRPPSNGLEGEIPAELRLSSINAEFIRVFIIEEPSFDSRTRLKFLSEEIEKVSGKILILTKSEDNVAIVDDFIRENLFTEFELSPVSFSETAFFLERAFDMSPSEAEAVAIRLDETFRKFRLDAHPTYFAGLQEETLAALINANKRAELIQLAVDGLLTMIVAADKSRPNLSRTTRERFLKLLVLQIASGTVITDEGLSNLANSFLKEHMFDVSQTEFLNPFFHVGLLYQCDGTIKFTHPYLESYLLAQALREQPDLARQYFRPEKEPFNYYAFDLYSEMGPDTEVINNIIKNAESNLAFAQEKLPVANIYLSGTEDLTSLSSPEQLQFLASSLMKNAEKMERPEKDEDVRGDKQRILDARRKIQSEVSSREPQREATNLPADVRIEFEALDRLSKSLSLTVTAIGSGAEALSGSAKEKLAYLSLGISEKFADTWTRNRLRIDFKTARNDLLGDDHIWKIIEDTGADPSDFKKIKFELELYLHAVELNTVLEPLGRILWRISATAGVKVLAPVLDGTKVDDPLQKIIRACWCLDVSPMQGAQDLKSALAEYRGSSLARIIIASHLLGRLYWHHYKTASADFFVLSARRLLTPIGLRPSPDRLEQATKGVTGLGTGISKRMKRRKR